MWKAFRGANGWYCAWEVDGEHYQGVGSMTERAAKRLAAAKNAEGDDDD